MLKSLEKKILITLAYSLQFNQALYVRELYLRLLGARRVTKFEFAAALANLVKSGYVSRRENLWFIPSLQTQTEQKKLIQLRAARAGQYIQKITETHLVSSFVFLVLGVRALVITGSVAVKNSDRDDDIDYMVITKKNRLWLIRPVLIAYAAFQGKRRSFAREEKNSWCFNLWLEEEELQISRVARSLYTAYEVAQTVWVFDAGGVQEHFIAQTAWVMGYIPRLRSLQKQNILRYVPVVSVRVARKIAEFVYTILSLPLEIILYLCNYVAFVLQYTYMYQHITREKVSLRHAFFHPRDTKKQVDATLIQLLKKIHA